MDITMQVADLGGPDESPEELFAKGWRYIDFPRMEPQVFDELVEVLGEDKAKWLSMADYGNAKRGQVIISPAGIQALKEWADRQPKRNQ